MDVNDSHANDRRYFDLMYTQMLDEGGCAAMMRDLLDRKITNNLNTAIETKALEAQRAIYRSTGDSVDIWLDECIGRASLLGISGLADDVSWPDDVDRMVLFEAYINWAKDMKIRTKGRAHFYRKVEGYGFIKHRPRSEGIRKWCYKVPPHDKFTTES